MERRSTYLGTDAKTDEEKPIQSRYSSRHRRELRVEHVAHKACVQAEG